MNRQELEALFLSNLAAIDRILSALCRRHALTGDDAQDFAAWAQLRLIENDYAVLAKFRGESSLPTYLTVVLAMLFRDHRVEQWGRWRPSAAALRAGAVGVRLETLLSRDGMRLSDAGELLRSLGLTTLSDRDLAKLAATFPVRTPQRPVQGGDVPADAEGHERADGAVDQEEIAEKTKKAAEALRRAMSQLTEEDQLIVRLHHMQSMSVADIARFLSLPQKPLYRLLERALRQLRELLQRDGISGEDIRDITDGPPEDA